jgi:hypothetical protein
MRRAAENSLNMRVDYLRRKLSHAPVVVQGTRSLLTWPAFDRDLEKHLPLVAGVTPGSMGGSKERDNRDAECRSEVSWPTVRAHQQAAAANTCHGQPDGEILMSETDDMRVSSPDRDGFCPSPFLRSAEDENMVPKVRCDALSQSAAIFVWPELCCSERAAGVQGHDAVCRYKSKLLKHSMGFLLLLRRDMQLDAR